MEIHPIVFAGGQQKKEYRSCEVNIHPGYDPETHEPPHVPGTFRDDDYRDRSVGQEWEYLVRPLTAGPLLVACRGKTLVLAAGHVRVHVAFSLWTPIMTDIF
jgi:hypothetical protein